MLEEEEVNEGTPDLTSSLRFNIYQNVAIYTFVFPLDALNTRDDLALRTYIVIESPWPTIPRVGAAVK